MQIAYADEATDVRHLVTLVGVTRTLCEQTSTQLGAILPFAVVEWPDGPPWCTACLAQFRRF